MGRVERYRRQAVHAAAGAEFELLVAEGAWARTVGLLAERRLDRGIGLLIPRCSSVHTIGMRFAIDVAFVRWLPGSGAWPEGAPARPEGAPIEILSVRAALAAWRVARLPLRAPGLRRREIAALELAAGEAERLGIAAGGSIVVGPA